MSDSLDLAIATIPYFRGLRPDERTRVADLMTRVILEPANDAMAPIEVDAARVRIQGKVIGLRRDIV